jgi:CheY-like chemotaxis protein
LTARRSEVYGAERLIISIADTGIGIAADQLPRVFDLFSQSAAHARGHRGGLGIGLSIARRLVEMHGGNLVAHSDGEQRGSEFVMTLPAVCSEPLGKPAPPPESSSLRGLNVIIVDDNHDAADSMSLLAQLEGADTRVAYAAEPALAEIEKLIPDVVLLDIGMPGMDGYEACRQIRVKHGPDIALIAVSGWGQDADKQMAMNAGFDAHLTKPADPEILAQTIARLARRTR